MKFTEFLTLVVQLPLCLYTSVLSGSSSERRPGAEEGGRIELPAAYVQNSTMWRREKMAETGAVIDFSP